MNTTNTGFQQQRGRNVYHVVEIVERQGGQATIAEISTAFILEGTSFGDKTLVALIRDACIAHGLEREGAVVRLGDVYYTRKGIVNPRPEDKSKARNEPLQTGQQDSSKI